MPSGFFRRTKAINTGIFTDRQEVGAKEPAPNGVQEISVPSNYSSSKRVLQVKGGESVYVLGFITGLEPFF